MPSFTERVRQVFHVYMYEAGFISLKCFVRFSRSFGQQGIEIAYPMAAQAPIQTRARHFGVEEFMANGQQIVQRQQQHLAQLDRHVLRYNRSPGSIILRLNPAPGSASSPTDERCASDSRSWSVPAGDKSCRASLHSVSQAPKRAYRWPRSSPGSPGSSSRSSAKITSSRHTTRCKRLQPHDQVTQRSPRYEQWQRCSSMQTSGMALLGQQRLNNRV